MALVDHSGLEVIDLTLSDDENDYNLAEEEASEDFDSDTSVCAYDDDLAEEEASEDFDSDTSVYAYASQAHPLDIVSRPVHHSKFKSSETPSIIQYPTPDSSLRSTDELLPVDPLNVNLTRPPQYRASLSPDLPSATQDSSLGTSTRLRSGTCGDMIPLLDRIYDGRAGRNVLRDREEHILANMSYTNADHMIMISWNRFGHEHGSMEHTDQEVYIEEYFAQYADLILLVEGVPRAMGRHLYTLWLQRCFDEAADLDGPDRNVIEMKAFRTLEQLKTAWRERVAAAAVAGPAE